jgi:hypothetical protein
MLLIADSSVLNDADNITQIVCELLNFLAEVYDLRT